MRENGFYWVKLDGVWIVSEWRILGENDQLWFVGGLEQEFYDNDFDAIGDKIDIPEKYR